MAEGEGVSTYTDTVAFTFLNSKAKPTNYDSLAPVYPFSSLSVFSWSLNLFGELYLFYL